MDMEVEKKQSGGYYIRYVFSVLFVIIMLVASAYGAYRGADWLVKHRSETYQEYSGYMQDKEDTDEILAQAAVSVLEDTVKVVSGTEAEKADYSDFYLLDQCVVTKDSYFKYQSRGDLLEKYNEISSLTKDSVFEERAAAFCYDGKTAYVKYPDGDVKEYTAKTKLQSMDTAISKMATTYGYSDVCVYTWLTWDRYEEMNPGLQFMDSLPDYNPVYILSVFGISAVCLLMAALVSVRTKNGMKRKKQIITEIPLLIMFADILGFVFVLAMLWDSFEYYSQNIKILVTIGTAAVVMIFYLAFRECILKIKERKFFRDCLIVRLIWWIGRKCKNFFVLILKKSNYQDFSLTKKLAFRKTAFLILTLIYIMFAAFVIWNAGDSWYEPEVGYIHQTSRGWTVFFIAVYLILYCVFSVYEYLVLKRLNEVYQQIDDIYQGNYAIRDLEKTDILYDVTDKLNSLSNGMEEAVERRISSEKMKVELITNVSHDLKTPLTSIISYVNLLKEEEMSDTASAYVKILEDKSYQLKNIVSDVFDIAKANSGQDIEIETIDGIMLINQVLADMNDTIVRSGKIVKTDIKPDTFFIRGDGKKLYRALQNLIDNALKYSMEGTRIYISSGVSDEKLKMVIKNIASYEMEFTGADIVERFVRGDESRTTEGSGLGLSIAKSFIEVSGGSMNVEVDGDVFCVTVEF